MTVHWKNQTSLVKACCDHTECCQGQQLVVIKHQGARTSASVISWRWGGVGTGMDPTAGAPWGCEWGLPKGCLGSLQPGKEPPLPGNFWFTFNAK